MHKYYLSIANDICPDNMDKFNEVPLSTYEITIA